MIEYNAPGLDVALQRVADWLKDEREAAYGRMLALGMNEAEIAQLMLVAMELHTTQLAWVERFALERADLISMH